MTDQSDSRKRRIRKELVLFLSLLSAGLLLLPGAVYVVGKAVFIHYGGGDFFDFSANLYRELLHGEPTVVFLLLSPYLVWQTLRMTLAGFRRKRPAKSTGGRSAV